MNGQCGTDVAGTADNEDAMSVPSWGRCCWHVGHRSDASNPLSAWTFSSGDAG